MLGRGVWICIAIMAGCEAVCAHDLAVAMGLGKFSKAELDQARPLFSVSTMYTPWSAAERKIYPEFVAGYWDAESPTVGLLSYAEGALDNGYGSRDSFRKWRGAYTGVRIVLDDERYARRERLILWLVIGVGGVAQWTDPSPKGGNPHGRASGFVRVSVPLEGNAVMFLELEGQTEFESSYPLNPGIEGVLKLGHRFRAF